jgi:hypothetical protein
VPIHPRAAGLPVRCSPALPVPRPSLLAAVIWLPVESREPRATDNAVHRLGTPGRRGLLTKSNRTQSSHKQRCATLLSINVTPTTNGDDSACGTIWLPLSPTLVKARVVSKHARYHSEPSQVFAERSSCSPCRLPGKRAVLQRPSLNPAATTSRL